MYVIHSALLPLLNQMDAKALSKKCDIRIVAASELTLSASPSEIVFTLPVHTLQSTCVYSARRLEDVTPIEWKSLGLESA